jgi:hypothetical protein
MYEPAQDTICEKRRCRIDQISRTGKSALEKERKEKEREDLLESQQKQNTRGEKEG